MLNNEKIDLIIEAAKEAGDSVMEIYETDFKHSIKNDNSPLTKADIASNNIICKFLSDLTPEIPIVSEENITTSFNKRLSYSQYWLVDPLDGTKEFINKNGEFTVNIALIENKKPIFGVVNAPAIGEIFWGYRDEGSFVQSDGVTKKKIRVRESHTEPIIVISRSHPSPELENWLKKFESYKTISLGSSLKLCKLATGDANLYPRFGPTSEWDIAAGHAVLKYAGGLLETIDGSDFLYGDRDSILNPSFIASSHRKYI